MHWIGNTFMIVVFRCFDLIIAPNITRVLWLELFLAKLRTLPGYAYSSPNQSLSLWTTLDLAGYNKLRHSIHPTPHVEIRMISIQCGQGWNPWHYHLLSQTSWNFFHSSPCIHPYKSKKYTTEGKNKKREVLLIRVGFKDGESCKLDQCFLAIHHQWKRAPMFLLPECPLGMNRLVQLSTLSPWACVKNGYVCFPSTVQKIW